MDEPRLPIGKEAAYQKIKFWYENDGRILKDGKSRMIGDLLAYIEILESKIRAQKKIISALSNTSIDD